MKTYRMTLRRMMMTVLMMLITVSAMSAEQKIWLRYSSGGKAKISLDGKGLELDKENKATVKDAAGLKVAVTATPDDGYTVSSVTAQLTTDAGNATRGADDAGFLEVTKSGSEYIFTMPEAGFNVVVNVTFSKKGGDSKNRSTGVTDYSGTYYIGSYGKDAANNIGYIEGNTETNFYLCPTEGWIYYEYRDSKDNYTSDDNGQPFITSYQCLSSSKTYDATKAVWVITKHATSEYYYIQQRKTGKYLVFNGQINTSKSANRIRVHLEGGSDSYEPNDYALFEITTNPATNYLKGAYLFHPKKADNDYYLNISEGNQDALIGTSAKTDGPTDSDFTKYVGGTLGQWNDANNTSSYRFEDVIPAPIITQTDDNMITITYPGSETVTLYYTTNGSKPDPANAGGNNPTQIYDEGTTTITMSDPVTTVKAIAVKTKETGEAIDTYSRCVTLTTQRYIGSNYPYMIQNVECTDFYMIPGDVNSGNTEVNTSSLFRSSMVWTFSNAGSDPGVQYYYIKNGTSYLYHKSDGKVYLKTSDTNPSDDGYKFAIVQGYDADSNPDGFHIVPKAQSSDNTYCIYKGGWGNTTPPTIANSKADVLKGSKNARRSEQYHTRWNFISAPGGVLPSSLTYDSSNPADLNWPAFLSSSTTTKYFKIENVGTAGQYMCPPTGEVAVGTATTGDNDLAWCVIEAGHDDWQKYYYIVHAATGKYMYFIPDIPNDPKTIGDQEQVIALRDYVASESVKYQFVFAKTTDAGEYFIVPRGLKDATYNSYYALYRDGTDPLKSKASKKDDGSREDGSYKWKFVTADLFCNNPVFEEKTVGEGKEIIISCTTNAAKIYYTADGTVPSEDPSKLYNTNTSWPVSEQHFIKAIAVVSDGSNTSSSSVVTLLNKPDITLETGSFIYKGAAWEPSVNEVSITINENKTSAPTSPATYEVASTDYTNNINASTNENKAKVTVRDVEGDAWYIWHASKEFTIEKKEIGLTWAPLDTSEPPLTSFVYNGIAQTPTATAIGLVGTDECTITVTISANEGSSLTGDNAINVGSYTATALALSNANYKLPEDITRAFTITRAPVTVTADDKTKGYGDDEPELTATVTGMVNDESAELITYTLSRAEGDSYGDYTITPAGEAVQGNYNVTYVTGTLTIGAKAIGDGTTPAEGITIDITYNGTNYQVTVKQGDNLLEEGETKDYTWEGTGTDTYIVTVTGHGNYANSAQATYFNVPFYNTTPGDNENTETAAAYCATQNLQPSGDIKAWYVTKLENNVLTIKEVKVVEGENEINYIPANQPVLLLGDASSNGFALKPYSGTTMDFPAEGEEDANILKVVTDEGGKAVDLAEVYVFSKGEFVLTMAGTLSKGKFYLENPSSPASSRSTLSTTRGETTGIKNPQLSKKNVPYTDMWYSLDGQRFNNKPTRKGLYLQNGKKVVIK